ncbi:MAG: hypothetical protein JF616_19055 [Fibrobacteres bacterium]|nr:hypothetical protein [Fibrobacterota bacterium]
MDRAEVSAVAESKVSANGMTETVLATLASGAMAILIAYMRVRGYGYWLAGIGGLYALSLGLSLRIHALTYRNGIFRGKPLLGKPIEFRGTAIAALLSDDRSRPPRARIELKDGRRILIKKPLWMGPVTAEEFEAKVRSRLEAGSL